MKLWEVLKLELNPGLTSSVLLLLLAAGASLTLCMWGNFLALAFGLASCVESLHTAIRPKQNMAIRAIAIVVAFLSGAIFVGELPWLAGM